MRRILRRLFARLSGQQTTITNLQQEVETLKQVISTREAQITGLEEALQLCSNERAECRQTLQQAEARVRTFEGFFRISYFYLMDFLRFMDNPPDFPIHVPQEIRGYVDSTKRIWDQNPLERQSIFLRNPADYNYDDPGDGNGNDYQYGYGYGEQEG